MKILVPTKRVPDPDQRIRVRDDGLGIETAALSFVINPFDAIALEEAVRIREGSRAEVEVVAVGIGADDYQEELRTALAMGADRALHIACVEACDPWNVARILCAVIQRLRPDLVLMGKQAVDDDANQTGQFMAALLGWPQATFASKLECIEQSLRVWRETDAGIQVVSVDLPAVVTTDLRLNEPRYASLPAILKARKKPLERVEFTELGVTIEPRVAVLEMRSAAQGRTCALLENEDELLDRLRNEARVI